MFKVGDKVKAKSSNEGNPYSITTNGWEGIVEELFFDIAGNRCMKVRGMDGIYPVLIEKFYLVKSYKETSFPSWLS